MTTGSLSPSSPDPISLADTLFQVCPARKFKLEMNRGRLFIAVFLVVIQQGIAATQVTLPVDKGTLTLTITGIHTNKVNGSALDSNLEGAVINGTHFTFNYLELELVAFNDAGDDLRICDE